MVCEQPAICCELLALNCCLLGDKKINIENISISVSGKGKMREVVVINEEFEDMIY